MSKKTWIIVANSADAKLYQLTKFPHIEEIESFEHAESRLNDRDLVSSKPGRNFQRGGTTRHAYEPASDPKELEMEKFARILGEFLNTSLQKGEFSRLYLFAGPTFLGMLRQYIDNSVKETIVSEVAKDIVKLDKSEIEHQLSLLQI